MLEASTNEGGTVSIAAVAAVAAAAVVEEEEEEEGGLLLIEGSWPVPELRARVWSSQRLRLARRSSTRDSSSAILDIRFGSSLVGT